MKTRWFMDLHTIPHSLPGFTVVILPFGGAALLT